MTRRERLEAKLEKRQEWAEGRGQRAEALNKRNEPFFKCHAFNTQPGHIPERARAIKRQEKAIEHSQMKRHHESKADGIERQLEGSIFSDDPDALEALEAKIAKLTKERDAKKRINALYKKGDAAKLLEEFDLRLAVLTAAVETLPSYRAQRPFEGYEITNMTANINRLKKRLVDVQKRQERAQRCEDAGGTLIEKHEEHNWCVVTFDEKPSREILDALRGAGYGWGGGSWSGYLDKLPEEVTK